MPVSPALGRKAETGWSPSLLAGREGRQSVHIRLTESQVGAIEEDAEHEHFWSLPVHIWMHTPTCEHIYAYTTNIQTHMHSIFYPLFILMG